MGSRSEVGCSHGTFICMLVAAGTGITLYAASANDAGTNLNVTLDGWPNSTTTVSANDLNVTYSISFYDIQSLPYGNHNVTVLLLDARDGPTHFGFDYAAINDTIPVLSSSIVSTSPAGSLHSRLVTTYISQMRYINLYYTTALILVQSLAELLGVW
jgi:hypothetical protein